jgi:GNAT superfamily N-acetyltransferase
VVSAEVIRVRPEAGWALRPAGTGDVEALAQLRATVLRADLQRLGRYDEHRVRQRMRDTFAPGYTSIIVIDGEPAGCVTLRPAAERSWLEHFYLAPERQGQGWGSAVLGTILEWTDAQGVTVGLNVLRGSAARRLYERHGFVVEAQDPVDVFMVRLPQRRVVAAGSSDGCPPASPLR